MKYNFDKFSRSMFAKHVDNTEFFQYFHNKIVFYSVEK